MWDVDGLVERNCVLNLMVIGDSEYELDAGKKFKKIAPQYTDKRIVLKLIKFKEDLCFFGFLILLLTSLSIS